MRVLSNSFSQILLKKLKVEARAEIKPQCIRIHEDLIFAI